MSFFTFEVEYDASDALNEALDNADLSGLGSDGLSEYEITSSNVGDATMTVTIDVEVERSEGKFAGRDEIAESIIGALQEIEGVSATEVPQPTAKELRQAAKTKALRDEYYDGLKDRAKLHGIEFDITDRGIVVTPEAMDAIMRRLPDDANITFELEMQNA
jgi:hypothetical protein